MDPRLVDQVLQTLLPVALVLIAVNIGAKMTGFGVKPVQKLTAKVTTGLLAVAFVWIMIAAIAGSFHR